MKNENEKEKIVDVKTTDIPPKAEVVEESTEAPKSAMEVLIEKNSRKILEALTTRLNKDQTSVGVTWGVPIIYVKLIFNDKAEFIFNINSLTGEFTVASKSLDEEAPYAVMSNEILEYVLATVLEVSEALAA